MKNKISIIHPNKKIFLNLIFSLVCLFLAVFSVSFFSPYINLTTLYGEEDEEIEMEVDYYIKNDSDFETFKNNVLSGNDYSDQTVALTYNAKFDLKYNEYLIGSGDHKFNGKLLTDLCIINFYVPIQNCEYVWDNDYQNWDEDTFVDNYFISLGENGDYSEVSYNLYYFYLENADDLKYLQESVNQGHFNGFYNKTILLYDNIDLDDSYYSDKYHIPIGTSEFPFKGSFNGNYFTISNLIIKDIDLEENEDLHIGFFGVLEGYVNLGMITQSIKNFKLENVFIGFTSAPGDVGVLCGKAQNYKIQDIAIIDNDDVADIVVVSSNYAVGGLIGNVVNCDVSNAYLHIGVFAGDSEYIGSFFGINNSSTKISSSYSLIYSGDNTVGITASEDIILSSTYRLDITQEQNKDILNFYNFDFKNSWVYEETISQYPILQSFYKFEDRQKIVVEQIDLEDYSHTYLFSSFLSSNEFVDLTLIDKMPIRWQKNNQVIWSVDESASIKSDERITFNTTGQNINISYDETLSNSPQNFVVTVCERVIKIEYRNQYGEVLTNKSFLNYLDFYVKSGDLWELNTDNYFILPDTAINLKVSLKYNFNNTISFLSWMRQDIDKDYLILLSNTPEIVYTFNPINEKLICFISFLGQVSDETPEVSSIDNMPEEYWKYSGGDEIIFATLNGSGTEVDPYEIGNINDLLVFKYNVENNLWDYFDKYYILTEDIDLEGNLWEPIGTNKTVFSGFLNGNSHTISGLSIFRGDENYYVEDYIGLFGALGGNAVIRDLTLDNIKISISNPSASFYIGGIAGKTGIGNFVLNVNVSGEIYAFANAIIVGGLFGYFDGLIEKSHSDCDISIEQSFVINTKIQSIRNMICVGGFVGQFGENSSLINSYFDANGNVIVITKDYFKTSVGFLVGLANRTFITNCYFAGDFYFSKGKVLNLVSGFANTISSSYFKDSYSTEFDFSRRTILQLSNRLNYVGWNFETMWSMGEFPVLIATNEPSNIEFIVYLNGLEIDLNNNFYPDVEFITGDYFVDYYTTVQFKINAKQNSFVDFISKDGKNISGDFLYSFDDNGVISFLVTSNTLGCYDVYIENDKYDLTAISVVEGIDSSIAGVLEIVYDDLNSDPVKTANSILQSTEYYNKTLFLRAIPNEGYKFIGWFDLNMAGELLSDESVFELQIKGYDIIVYAKYTMLTPIFIDQPIDEISPNNDTFIINTLDNLVWFVNRVNGTNGLTAFDFSGKTVVLGESLNIAECFWVPIGTIEHPFSGTFDGGGKVLSGLRISECFITSDNLYYGMFGYIKNASITNLYLESINIFIDENTESEVYIGAFVGYMFNSYLTLSYAKGNISTSANTGGLVGLCETELTTVDNNMVKNTYAMVNINYFSEKAGSVSGLVCETKNTYVKNSYVVAQIQIKYNNPSIDFFTITSNSEAVSDCWFDNDYGFVYLDGVRQVLSLDENTLQSSSDMKSENSGIYNNWDFEEVWSFVTLSESSFNNGYPILNVFNLYNISVQDGLEIIGEKQDELYSVGTLVKISAVNLGLDESISAWYFNGSKIVDFKNYTRQDDSSISFIVQPNNAGYYEAEITYKRYNVIYKYNNDTTATYVTLTGDKVSILIPSVNPVRSGYGFVGWNTESNGQGQLVSDDFGINGDVNLYAIWNLLKFDVTFNYNYIGSQPKVESGFASITGFENPLEVPERVGYSFDQWNTKPQGDGAIVVSTMPVNKNITIYAIWNTLNYTAIFDYNYENGPVVESYGNINGTVAPYIPSRLGYNFEGWFTERGTNGVYGFEFDANVPLYSDITVYARWTKKEIEVKFYVDDKLIDTKIWLIGEYILPAAPYKSGYTFYGWRLPNGTILTEYNLDSTSVYEDVILNAVWSKSTVMINMSIYFEAVQSSHRTLGDYVKIIITNSDNTLSFVYWLKNGQNFTLSNLAIGTYNIKVILPTGYTLDDSEFEVELSELDFSSNIELIANVPINQNNKIYISVS